MCNISMVLHYQIPLKLHKMHLIEKILRFNMGYGIYISLQYGFEMFTNN